MSKRHEGVRRFSRVRLVLSLCLAAFVAPAMTATASDRGVVSNGSGRKIKEVYVMAPLTEVHDWSAFSRRLQTLKRNGVTGLTTDIWWGQFERDGNNRFDWSYYLRYAQTVRAAGLKWIPILSFHRCGGNVGDDCDVPLPPWVWSLAPDGDSDDLKFVDEHGYVNGEYLSFWFEGAYDQYREAMDSFSDHFRGFQGMISKVYVSLGPAGELRYPSYYFPAGWRYPDRGKIQAYSGPARADFVRFIRAKYGNDLGRLNSAWGTGLSSFQEVSPPNDGDRFFRSGRSTGYGQDFLDWYQGVLVRHLRRMMTLARREIAAPLAVPLGGKLAGIHWLYSSPEIPRAAELAAGYADYEELIRAFRDEAAQLTFTCLEKDDRDRWSYPYYSAPRTLVREVAGHAARLGVPLFGENALPITGSDDSYYRVADALRNYGFSGFTLLRIGNIVDADGNETSEMRPFRDIVIAAANGRRPARRVSSRPGRSRRGRTPDSAHPRR